MLSVYGQTGPWQLFFKYTFKRQWWRVILIVVLMIAIAVGLYHALDAHPFIKIILLPYILLLLLLIYLWVVNKFLDKKFRNEKHQYNSLFKNYRDGWEFYRYIYFRTELMKLNLKSEDIDYINLLISLDQQSLGSYVARKPVASWIYATSGAVVATSAANWPSKIMVQVVIYSFVALMILHLIPIFISNQRRQYELHRWLAWYKAELEPTALTADRTSSLPG